MDKKENTEDEPVEYGNDVESKRLKERSLSPLVKSTAVMKYTTFQSPVGYSRLQCNTDLNSPPSNWNAAVDSYGLQEILPGGHGFSSFCMAHMFPDCVGEVDVISGAECIKNLLKLPYHPTGTVSMIVHRVANTIFLDDFNVYDYLMKSEWSWLRDFFVQHISKPMSEQDRMALMLAPKQSTALQLLQRFLTRSVDAIPPRNLPMAHTPLCIPGPFLPVPEECARKPPDEHFYNQNVSWTFENIHMLIGSDLTIFGDENQPCVSLRLKDAMEKPINVLTGIDYWLDNLICNVPEVVMCCHAYGVIQKYEQVKTEDLPGYSQFSQNIIKNVAQNILSFLKLNVTEPGHTYWLYKGPHDEYVKLYDLTKLCPMNMDNPFTTPVAMLLYQVARNMRINNKTKNVKKSLKHAIELLDVKKYPQIVASSYYMLADLLVPIATNPGCPNFKEESSDSDDDMELDGSTKSETKHTRNVQKDDIKETRDSAMSAQKDDLTLGAGVASHSGCGDSLQNDNDHILLAEEDTVKQETRKRESDNDDNMPREEHNNTSLNESNSTPQKRFEAFVARYKLKFLRHEQKRALRDAKRKPRFRRKVPNGLGTDIKERCYQALEYSLSGLQALHYVTISKCKEDEKKRFKEQIIKEEQNPKMANPNQPISMPYEPIRKQSNGSERGVESKERSSRSRRRRKDKNKVTDFHPANDDEVCDTANNKNISTDNAPEVDRNSIFVLKSKTTSNFSEPKQDDEFAWKVHLKILLYEKLCTVFSTLAEHSYSMEAYGLSLQYIFLAGRCQKLLCNMILKSKVIDVSCLLGRIADCYYQMNKNWSKIDEFKKQLDDESDLVTGIKMEIENDFAEEVDGEITDSEYDFDVHTKWPSNAVEAMEIAVKYYRRALKHERGNRIELMRRLGSVLNDLSLRFMNIAQKACELYVLEGKKMDNSGKDDAARKIKKAEMKTSLSQIKDKSKKCSDYIHESLELFKDVDDAVNLALVYCNKGRYIRFICFYDIMLENTDWRHLYGEAEECYQKAIELLGPREAREMPELWESITWEIATHLLNKATIMHEAIDKQGYMVAEVTEAYKKALKYCLEYNGSRPYQYQFRTAVIYRKLAIIYHAEYRLTTKEGPRMRKLFTQAQTNYEESAKLYAILEDCAEYLTIILTYTKLLHEQTEKSPNLKMKNLQSVVQLLRQCKSVIQIIEKKSSEENDDKVPHGAGHMDSESGLLALYHEKLQESLRTTLHYYLSQSSKHYDKLIEMYRKLYKTSISVSKTEEKQLFAGNICKALNEMDNICAQFK